MFVQLFDFLPFLSQKFQLIHWLFKGVKNNYFIHFSKKFQFLTNLPCKIIEMKLSLILVICLFHCAILLMQPTDVDAGSGKNKAKRKGESAPKPKSKFTDEEKEALKPKTPEEKEKVKANRVAKKVAKKAVEQCVVINYSQYL